MTVAEALDLGREAVEVTLIVITPTMLIALVVGVVVSLLQALTQIQELTLVYVPKIFVVFFALLIFMPLMGSALGAFAESIFARIANY
ncbi:MAG TPA: flagellar biosynthetic protein FliQ [Hyphomonadaceae bacterium]|nr:flagellar biosynthetic protein FliQ [Hyphomonadaceae bacterium]